MGRNEPNSAAMFAGVDSAGDSLWECVFGHGAITGPPSKPVTHISSDPITKARLEELQDEANVSYSALDTEMASSSSDGLDDWWALVPSSGKTLFYDNLKVMPIC